MNNFPSVSIVVPSFNQGEYLDECLSSIFSQNINSEVFVMDGGSTDNSLDIIKKWSGKIKYWRSFVDNGQSAAINEGMKLATSKYCCWLNSDDYYMHNKLCLLIEALELNKNAPVAYGNVDNFIQKSKRVEQVWVEAFSAKRLAMRCIISQPGTLIRRSAWDAVSGLDHSLHMAMDYDLWWKLFIKYGDFIYVDKKIAVNRDHFDTKTNTKRYLHYREAMIVVKKYNGSIPLKWWFLQPYSIWFKSLINLIKSFINK